MADRNGRHLCRKTVGGQVVQIIYSDELTSEALAKMGGAQQRFIYNALDCCLTSEIHGVLKQQLTPATQAIYRYSRDLQGPVLEMNLRGVLVDAPHRGRVIHELSQDILRVEHNLDQIIIEGLGLAKLNWNSPHQVKHLLYNVLNLPPQKHQGKITANRDALEKMTSHFHAEPIINHILCLRDMSKRRSALQTGMSPDGRIRTTYGIAGTETGRFSSYGASDDTGGNLQNWEKRIRRILVADPDMKFAYPDLKTAESIALGARCWNLFYPAIGEAAGKYLSACETGDVHTSVARNCWPQLPWTGDIVKDKEIAEATKFYRDHDYRHMTKILGHGTNLYGKPFHMSKHTKIPIQVIAQWQEQYFAQFPELRMYHHWCAQELATKGSDTSLMGRPRSFFGRRNDDATLREFIAYSQQETVAHILGLGTLSLWRARICQLLLQVHDALLIQYPEEQEDKLIPQIRKHMEIEVPLLHGRVMKIPVDFATGWNWGPWEKDGSNPDGMKGYNGHDVRRRTETPTIGRLDNLLCGIL